MPKDYEISRPAGTCTACERTLEPSEEFMAAVVESGEELQRLDYCLTCWDSQSPGRLESALGVWRSRVPAPQEPKKKLLVDDQMLVELFERLDGTKEPSKRAFRFVLALVLMRKKRLIYDRADRRDGAEVWKMRLRGSDREFDVIDPHMNEERIAQVREQLAQIMEGQE